MTFSSKDGVHAWAEEGASVVKQPPFTLNDLLRDSYSMFARPAYLLVSVLWLRLANGQLIQGKQPISVAIWLCIVSLLSLQEIPLPSSRLRILETSLCLREMLMVTEYHSCSPVQRLAPILQ